MNNLYTIRDATADDHNLVYATFLKGLYYGDTWFSEIPKPIFMTCYKPVIEKMLKDPMKYTVKIACLNEDPSVIIGYSILSADYQGISWVFVKARWRKLGIAKSLVPKYPSYVTHLTPLGKSLLTKFETNPIFNPFAT